MSELFSIQLQNRQQQGRNGVWRTCPLQPNRYKRPCGKSAFRPIIRRAFFISGYFAEEEKRFAIPL